MARTYDRFRTRVCGPNLVERSLRFRQLGPQGGHEPLHLKQIPRVEGEVEDRRELLLGSAVI